MAHIDAQNINKSEEKKYPKYNKNALVTPIRVRQKTKAKLDQLLNQANKERLGKKEIRRKVVDRASRQPPDENVRLPQLRRDIQLLIAPI